MHRPAALVTLLLAAACTPPEPPAPPPPPTAVPVAEPPPPPPAPAPPAPAEVPCGALGCKLYDVPVAAFRAVLAGKPQILALGEAHAQKATSTIPSSAKRFTEQMLPELEGKASDLVIELMVPPTGCEAKTKVVKKEMARVTKNQAETNQNEYVTMGDAAKKLGIQPRLIFPTCADMKAVSAPGANPVEVSLVLIARLMRETAEKLLARNAKEGIDKIIVLYGGAIHNDVAPAEAARDFVFGPQLLAATKGRYVELDLFVPEMVQTTGLWARFPWTQHFDKAAHPDKTTLYAPVPGSFAMILPATPKT